MITGKRVFRERLTAIETKMLIAPEQGPVGQWRGRTFVGIGHAVAGNDGMQ